MSERQVVVIACRALEDLIRELLPDRLPMTFLGYELHTRPQDMRPALQSQIDALPAPSLVLLGYGLCGNGVVGVRAGPHVLVMPRTHDCIAVFLGSYQAYADRFRENPATFYLTTGWLESGDGPLFDWQTFKAQYDEDTADYLVDMMYRHYRRICFVAFSEAELAHYRPQAMEVAEFCRRRWSMSYEELLGSEAMVARLLAAPRHVDQGSDEFVVIGPGGEVTAEMFHRAGGGPAQSTARARPL